MNELKAAKQLQFTPEFIIGKQMTDYFPTIDKIKFEGSDSKNPFCFRYYNPDLEIAGKTLRDHLRFAVAYWHTFQNGGRDVFGDETCNRAWKASSHPMETAESTLDAAFQFFQKLGVDYYCFHDRDIAPEGSTFKESCRNLEFIVEKAKKKQQETGVKLLWGTANLFGNPRFANGAASNPDAHVFAYAAAQVKNAIAATHELGGENYVFWGGREGYDTLLNTNMELEQDNLARFFHMAVDYAREIGFKGQFLIEPKPKEPTKHQYDFDAATVLGFLRKYDLADSFKLNIEANHATLAGHDFDHDLMVAATAGKLGSIDVNRGDLLLGWDTDQFPTDLMSAVRSMVIVLNQGGIGSGGLNFDAKLRRSSMQVEDLFHAHIGGMDTFAKATIIAAKMLEDGFFETYLDNRYASYKSGIGQKIVSKELGFKELEQFILENGEPEGISGQQEYLENVFNTYIW